MGREAPEDQLAPHWEGELTRPGRTEWPATFPAPSPATNTPTEKREEGSEKNHFIPFALQAGFHRQNRWGEENTHLRVVHVPISPFFFVFVLFSREGKKERRPVGLFRNKHTIQERNVPKLCGAASCDWYPTLRCVGFAVQNLALSLARLRPQSEWAS